MTQLEDAPRRRQREHAERNGGTATAVHGLGRLTTKNNHSLTRPEGRTDVSNAARLVARYGELIRWVGPWDKWIIWDGSRWKIDQALGIDRMAKDIATDIFLEIAAVLKARNG